MSTTCSSHDLYALVAKGRGAMRVRRDSNDDDESDVHKMLQAVYNEDIEGLRQLVGTVSDINQQDGDMETALLAAVRGNHIEMVDVLTRAGASVNIFGRHFKPLECAMQNMSKAMVRLLLERGGDIYKVHEYETEEVHKSNALRDAFKIGSCYKQFCTKEYVDMLLEHDDGLSEPLRRGAYALNAAAAIGDIDRVNTYLEHGVRFEDCWKVETHPLLNACMNQHVEVVKTLLDNDDGFGFNQADPCPDSWPLGRAPLSCAILVNNREILRLLLEKGATYAGYQRCITIDAGCHSDEIHLTGLMLACQYHRSHMRDIVRDILSYSHIDVNETNEDGMTALYYTTCSGKDRLDSVGIVKDLLHAGAVNQPRTGHCLTTPLEFHLNNVLQYQTDHIRHEQIVKIALILKSCGSGNIDLEHFLAMMRRMLSHASSRPIAFQKLDRVDDLLDEGVVMFENINNILEIVIMSGSRPTPEFTETYNQFISKFGSKNTNSHWLTSIESNGYTLKQLARMKIRHLINRPLIENAFSNEIALPTILKHYIVFDDIMDTGTDVVDLEQEHLDPDIWPDNIDFWT